MLLVYEPLKRLSHLNASLQEGLSASSRVFSIIDTQPGIVEAAEPQRLLSCEGHIHFYNVSFSYAFPSTGEDRRVLKNISLDIAAGSYVAFVGSSGAGKTTIINLIPRFYDISEGSLTIDGCNIQELSLQDLRKNIALVSQDVALFEGSVYENILYGRMEASSDEVRTAAELAYAHEFITQLPQGYDTWIGENGVRLSGGQRQRLTLARALLKNAPILLLDEATSSLDTESERQIQAALKNLIKGRTTLMVAHRLSTVVEADCIYVMDQGAIVEQGTHKDLLKMQGIYAQLWNQQSL
jgi:subfamily B ATP-binding cassette protein MsbA